MAVVMIFDPHLRLLETLGDVTAACIRYTRTLSDSKWIRIRYSPIDCACDHIDVEEEVVLDSMGCDG